MSLGSEPAYPVECDYVDGLPRGRQTASRAGFEVGLTKRELLAAMAMQGLVANRFGWGVPCGALAFEAVKQADALIAELSKPKGGGA